MGCMHFLGAGFAEEETAAAAAALVGLSNMLPTRLQQVFHPGRRLALQLDLHDSVGEANHVCLRQGSSQVPAAAGEGAAQRGRLLMRS